MDYKTFCQNLDKKVHLEINEPMLSPSVIKQIEDIIKKPLPPELIEFYTFCDGLTWKNDNTCGPPPKDIPGIPSMREDIPSLETMFDNFKTQPDLEFEEWDDEGENWSERSEYFHGSIFLEDLSPYGNELLDISTEEGRDYFLILSNMKLLCNINGHEGTIVIDFIVTQKQYQLYYHVYGDLYRINLSLEQYFKVFLQIGLTNFWFCAYMDKEVQDATLFFYNKDTHKRIQHFYPNFDLSQLPPIPTI